MVLGGAGLDGGTGYYELVVLSVELFADDVELSVVLIEVLELEVPLVVDVAFVGILELAVALFADAEFICKLELETVALLEDV